MRPTDELRASRDGDQFHYIWAARQSLKLLDSTDDLVLLHVEGVSDADATVNTGDQVVDLAEYRGGSTLADARRVVYRQFKHSTNQEDRPWTSSWLRKTLVGFAHKYLAATRLELAEKVEFEIVTNRGGNPSVLRALKNLALLKSSPRTGEAKYLYGVVADILPKDHISQFYSKLTVSDREPNVLALRDLLEENVRGVLPGTSGDEHILLKEMISARANSLEGDRPYVTRNELLAALRTDEYSLLPAPDEFLLPSSVIDSGQIAEVAEQVEASVGTPCIVHAAGGVGKSVLAHTFERELPPTSTTIVYDCFANGAYRRASSARHEPKRAYVQIVNELAARSLCTPVVPSGSATESDYARMFLTRLNAASRSVSQSDSNGLIVIAIDAADSAEVAAREFNGRSFVPQLLREQVPENVRIVAFCRTERSHLLDPPPNCQNIALRGFTAEETRQHVATKFPSTSSSAADEVHLISDGNPRVQAQILESASSLSAALESLGQTDRGSVELLDDLLERAVRQAIDAALGNSDKLHHICTALAALRPLIPIDVLARLADVTPTQISSFVSDLGRPILIAGGMVQFRDEPTETWFQQQYKPQGRDLAAFLDRLRPLADQDPYAAASLPELLLQSERVDELVSLALTDDRLPRASPLRLSAADSELERRELAQQRAQLALRACLRKGRDFDGARLALRTGALTAGRTRRIELIKSNIDLAGEFLDSQVLEHLVATRAFLSSWPGSNLHIEGALLSGLPEQRDLARVRLRSAEASLEAWVNRPAARDEGHDVGVDDIAALAWGHLNATDVKESAEFVSRWSPATIGFEAGLIIARHLLDSGRLDELEALVEHGHRSRHLQLSVAQACYEANVQLSTTTLRRLLSIIRNRNKPIKLTDRDAFQQGYNDGTGGIVWIVSESMSRGILGAAVAERVMQVQLDEVTTATTSSYRHSAAPAALRGAALLARVRNEPFDPIELARPDIAKELRGQSYQSSWEARDFRANIIPLTPWLELWADVATGSLSDPMPRLAELMQSTFSTINSREPQYRLLASSVPLAAQILAGREGDLSDTLLGWIETHAALLDTTALTAVVRSLAPHVPQHAIALQAAGIASSQVRERRQDASDTSRELLALARAIYPFGRGEARAYFQDAVEVTDAIGDDARARWDALLAMAPPAAPDTIIAAAERAFRLCEIAEHVEPYVGESPNPINVLPTAALLNAPTTIAFGSRWRDRRFALFGDIAYSLTKFPTSALGSDPTSLIAFAPLSGGDPLPLLARALQLAPTRGEALSNALGLFDHGHPHRAESYRALDSAADASGVDLGRTPFAKSGRSYISETPPATSRWTHRAESDPRRLTNTSSLPDLRTPEGWAEALRLVDDRDTPMRDSDILIMAANSELADLPAVLNALANTWSARRRHMVGLLLELSYLPVTPRSVLAEMRKLMDVLTLRFAEDLLLRPYDIVDLGELAQVCGTEEVDYLGRALMHLGSSSEAISAEEAYALAARLTARITPAEAGTVFDDCCALFSEVLPTGRSDGPSESALRPPSSVTHCSAGFLWAALGDMSAEVRWRAAHAVRLAMAAGTPEDWRALHDYADETVPVAPFVSPDLYFYRQHAMTWLLLALARAAHDPICQAGVLTFEALLRRVCLEHEPHVVMQWAARKALLALHRVGLIDLGEKFPGIEQLGLPATTRDTPGYAPPLVEPSCSLAALSTAAITNLPEATRNFPRNGRSETRFDFFFDFSDYWCRALGEAFGITEETIEKFADEVVIDHWHSSFRGSPEEDHRIKTGVYDRDNYMHKQDWPSEDRLDFYLSLHALYVVAGHLVRALSPYKHEELTTDEYTQWLTRHIPARPDGRWLADRRDSTPSQGRLTDGQGSENSTRPDHWIFDLARLDFESVLAADNGMVAVWGWWEDRTYSRSQTVSVRSALVTSSTAPSLLTALQTAPSSDDFRIPDTRDREYSHDEPDFTITGWVDELDHHPEAADTRDPHAGSVSFPPPQPTEEIQTLLSLASDLDRRIWTRGRGDVMLESQVWSDEDRDGRGASGHRLTITPTALQELLTRTGRSLLLEVQVRRNIDRQYRTGLDDDERFAYFPPSAKYYLVDQHGQWFQYP